MNVLPPARTDGDNENTKENRRELLKKLGLYGAYTAPALLIFYESAKAQAISLIPS